MKKGNNLNWYSITFSANLLLAQNGKVENKQADTEIRNNLLLIGQYYQSVEKDFCFAH